MSKERRTRARALHAHVPVLTPSDNPAAQALTPLTIGRGRAAATALGALWGFGHSTGQLILGLVFVVLKVRWDGRRRAPRSS
jgi:hypothetical protein